MIDALARINGVGQVSLFGPLDYSLRVWLDPTRLTALSLTPNDVITAVQGQNVQAALGRIGAAPVSSDQQYQLTVKTQGRLTKPEEFANIILRTNPGGSVVRVKDVARVELGARTSDRYSRFNGAPGAAMGIYQSPGANAIEVAKKVAGDDGGALQALPGRSHLRHLLRHHGLRQRHDRRGHPHPARSLRAGRHRRLPVPRQAAHHHHPADRRAGLDHRHLRGDAR